MSWQTWIVLAVSFTAFVVLGWRTTLPCNRHRELDTLAIAGRQQAYPFRFIANTYDEGVTQVSARNFARDGYLHTHLLANRGGFPLASLYDVGQTQCDRPTPPKHLVRYEYGRGKAIAMRSLNNECVYAHFPPLADWVFGAMAKLGFDQYGDYRVFAVGLNCLSLVVLYFWLRREVSEWAAALAVVLTATLPAFVHWSDALFFHPFQFLFLFTALLTRSLYLERGRARWLGCTWTLFLAQSLLTYQLLPCFAVMMVGLVVAEGHRALTSRIRLSLRLFSAPLLATAFHFSLRLGHMGAGYTWDNVHRTLHDRTLVGLSYLDFVRLLLRIREDLLRFDLIALSVLLVIAVRLAARLPLRRPLVLLLSAFLGGIGFWVVLPATALLHYWMTYRHQMPFVILLLALVAEACWIAPKERARPCSSLGAHPIVAYGLALACCCPLAWTSTRNLADIGKAIELARLRTPTAEANLATHYLDLAQWSSGFGRRGDERLPLLFVTTLRQRSCVAARCVGPEWPLSTRRTPAPTVVSTATMRSKTGACRHRPCPEPS